MWDKDGQSYRKACYKDMVILLRSMSGWSEVFVNVLMNEGIPATAQTRTGYFATAEVETVLGLLSVIDNPMQDIPMAAVLRSPMVGMTDDEMAWMIAAYKRYLQKNRTVGYMVPGNCGRRSIHRLFLMKIRMKMKERSGNRADPDRPGRDPESNR